MTGHSEGQHYLLHGKSGSRPEVFRKDIMVNYLIISYLILYLNELLRHREVMQIIACREAELSNEKK